MKENKETKKMGLNVPVDAHSTLKIFAATKDINLINFTEHLVTLASKNQELLEKAAQETLRK